MKTSEKFVRHFSTQKTNNFFLVLIAKHLSVCALIDRSVSKLT